MEIAVALEIILDRLRVIGDTARPEQRLGIRRKKAGKRYTCLLYTSRCV